CGVDVARALSLSPPIFAQAPKALGRQRIRNGIEVLCERLLEDGLVARNAGEERQRRSELEIVRSAEHLASGRAAEPIHDLRAFHEPRPEYRMLEVSARLVD